MSPITILAAFLGTIAFSILYSIPPKYWIGCGIIGGCGWIVYALLSSLIGATFAIFLSTAVVTFLSRLAAVRMKTPEIVFLIAGIFTLVPGADIYWSVYYLVSREMDKAVISGSDAFLSCLGIVFGIVIIHEIPQKLFMSNKRREK